MPLFLLFLSFILQCAGPVQQSIRTGRVVKVADGDTLTILDADNNTLKIRLYGIDCPERGQDFSNVAKRFTAEFCLQKQVHISVRDIDRYGRIVGVLYREDKAELNLALLEAGLAWHYTAYDRSDRYARAEARAKRKKKGLWAHRNAQPPWKFRQFQRNKRSMHYKLNE